MLQGNTSVSSKNSEKLNLSTQRDAEHLGKASPTSARGSFPKGIQSKCSRDGGWRSPKPRLGYRKSSVAAGREPPVKASKRLLEHQSIEYLGENAVSNRAHPGRAESRIRPRRTCVWLSHRIQGQTKTAEEPAGSSKRRRKARERDAYASSPVPGSDTREPPPRGRARPSLDHLANRDRRVVVRPPTPPKKKVGEGKNASST